MKKLVLMTVSAMALGIAGAGIGHAAESVHPATMPQGTQVMPGARTENASGAQAENWSKSRIKEVQRRLKTADAYNGPINGHLDAQTEQAISKFQGEHGLTKTGKLDRRTLAELNHVTNGAGSSAEPGAANSATGGRNSIYGQRPGAGNLTNPVSRPNESR